MEKKPTHVGALRPSQLLHTYGVGAIVDLPNISAMVMGVDDWAITGRCRTITEDRLLRAVRWLLGDQVERMIAPPMPEETSRFLPVTDESPSVGVPVATFPRYLRCPLCNYLGPLEGGLFRLKPDQYHVEKICYVHDNCAKALKRPPTALPARFLVACERGHIDDFPWREFVHKGSDSCNGVLELQEINGTGEATDVRVYCKKCEATRLMAEAFGEAAKDNLPACRGRNPHLRDFDEKPCDQPLKTILLNASNSWFPVLLSALYLPVGGDKLDKLVDEKWRMLSDVDEPATIKFLRKQGELGAFNDYSDENLWKAIEKRRETTAEEKKFGDLKTPEWALFTDAGDKAGNKDFKVNEVKPPDEFKKYIDRVLLVERLREVSALVGFTRIRSPSDLPSSDEKVVVCRAPLSRTDPRVVPASEVRGEGIFITLSEKRIAAWSKKARDREVVLEEAHSQWREKRNLTSTEAKFLGLRYVMVHSFAHALMRQLSLECGYSAASLRERIYAREKDEEGPAMAGLLIYTSAPDSEGTLGGLVSLGRPDRLGRHIRTALEAMRLCASDPLCAEHQPDKEEPTLHGASCHACLFAPETSCERSNRFLDRNLLVRTVALKSWAFFEEGE